MLRLSFLTVIIGVLAAHEPRGLPRMDLAQASRWLLLAGCFLAGLGVLSQLAACLG